MSANFSRDHRQVKETQGKFVSRQQDRVSIRKHTNNTVSRRSGSLNCWLGYVCVLGWNQGLPVKLLVSSERIALYYLFNVISVSGWLHIDSIFQYQAYPAFIRPTPGLPRLLGSL